MQLRRLILLGLLPIVIEGATGLGVDREPTSVLPSGSSSSSSSSSSVPMAIAGRATSVRQKLTGHKRGREDDPYATESDEGKSSQEESEAPAAGSLSSSSSSSSVAQEYSCDECRKSF